MAKVGGFTRRPDGYYRWYKGKTRFVCAATVPVDDVDERWVAKRKEIDGDADQADRDEARAGAGEMTVREVLSAFFKAMQARVDTGKPTPLAPRTFHNYETDLNAFGKYVGGSMPIRDVGPRKFAAYASTIAHLKASGYDSKVANIKTLFCWAEEMEYIAKARFGPGFARAAKRDLRDDRITRTRSFTPAEVRKILDHATGAMKAMTMLGIAGGLNNSEVAHLDRACVDLKAGVLDFRRRKTGKVRRVVPLPVEIVDELRKYRRPEPRDAVDASLFFLTVDGNPYVRMRAKGQANTVTVLFNRLTVDAGVRKEGAADGRSFAGLRTTFFNLAPRGAWELERKIVMGRAQGTVDLDSYLEDVGMDRLRHVVDHVWNLVSTAPTGEGPSTASTPAVDASAGRTA